ncbi:diguanylate cyclase (GGDEF)-like protein/PAS domain S-box-containing protein [Variovorax sp. TBS-050B]|uniref:sensor domain-containing diguanylate cyclase n=1 Tax=Variovorax sp. TBS-050B TaxID=2940551 RepID=UPI002475AF8F|nr:PAS domain-containing protein [Variovorax sp. TBS-050B]MDH6594983.1 diguanylate cyclase (GGDEF)-like protein/PAS domain S-box-containing protein [Variovorax sp. TBS-050B]
MNTRLSLGVALVVLLTTIAIATAALQLVRTSTKASIESEEFARLSAVADTIDQKFASWRTLLQTFAASMEAADLADAAALQLFLERHPSLRRPFSNVAIFTADGDLLASFTRAQPGPVNIADRPYFRETLAARAGVISEPYLNRLSGLAQIAITQPVMNGAGEVRFVISAAVNLTDRSILGDIGDMKFGETGYVFITNTSGVIISHPRTELIINQAGLKGTGNPEVERPAEGYEGIAEGYNHAGVHGMYAFKRITQTNWVVGAMYPTSEAFARFEAIQRTAWIGAVVLALLAGALALAVVHRQLDPLRHLHRHMVDAENLATEIVVLPAYPRDEIGDLRRTFDTLMLQRRASEKFLRDITDNLPAMIAHVDADGRYTFVNEALARKLGLNAVQLVGEPMRGLSGIGEDEAFDDAIRRVLAGEAVSLELRGDPRRGEQDRHFQTELIPERDKAGRVHGYYAMTSDVTERKRIEFSLAHSEAQVRTIADNIPALVSHVDASLRYTFVNAQVRMLHQGRAMVGRLMPEVRGPADYAIVAPAYARALAGQAVVIEKTGDPALGVGDRTFKAHYIPDIDANGVVQGVFAMTFDITDEVNSRRALTEQEKRLRDVTDNIPALVGYFDNDENCLFGNVRARQMAGLGDGPLEGVTLRSAVGYAVYKQQLPYLPMVREGKAVRFPVRAPLHGKTGYFQVNLIPDRNIDGKVQGFYLMTFNITALKRAELRQAESERRLRTITDNLPALITYIDRDERVTFANATYRDWLGVEPSAILGRHLRDVAGAELYLSRKAMIARALAGERVEFEAQTRTPTSERMTRVSYVPDMAPDGTVRGIFSLSLDISALKAVERKLSDLARVDTLTGLANRLAFNEFLPGAVARAQRAERALAVMFLDIDHFKGINDSLGHATGDGVLVEYARRLRESVRAADTVARLAGDEFVVVLENLYTREDAVAVARKIVHQIGSTPFELEGRSLRVTTSIGVAFQQAGAASVAPADLLARADAALYRAKSAGRNTFGFSD